MPSQSKAYVKCELPKGADWEKDSSQSLNGSVEEREVFNGRCDGHRVI